ncbi:MBL fold metallo-hydrolase [Pseudonocardia sp.]|uniref:MBL fold metallo-hydrolase n=1 Tax=Pseudonocardia sp. TaxID=60912 RepID=UPI0031FBDBC9
MRWMPYLHSVVEASRRLRGGEEMVVGGERWEVVHTPGHSLGHVCLWSSARRVLLSGDHLLPAITRRAPSSAGRAWSFRGTAARSATPSGGSRPSSATSSAVWSPSAARSRSGPRP